MEKIELNYKLNDLKECISETTLNYHYNRHYQKYIDNANFLLKGTQLEDKSSEWIIKSGCKLIPGQENNIYQVFNHELYFKQFTKTSSKVPPARLYVEFAKNFSSFENFKNEFETKSMEVFGSGYAWVVQDQNKSLKIIQTQNAKNPLSINLNPILVNDLWEHTYYLDYKNDRQLYVKNFWKIIDWKVIESRLYSNT